MKEDPAIALFKLGKQEHMAELLHEGRVFMNPLSYFASLDRSSLRADPDEGIGYSTNMNGGSVAIQVEGSSEWQPVGTIVGPVRERDEGLSSANLYCLHTRRRSDYGTVFRLDELGFGDTFVVFFDPEEFLRRLGKAAVEAGHGLQWRQVEYVGRDSHTGPMGLFRKFSEFSDHREFRVAALPGTGQPLSLHLGDLSDIAYMGPATKRMRLDPPKANSGA